jgi:hypothetical protein
MFLAGICQVFKHPLVRIGLTALAAASCMLGLARIVGLPALTP